VQKTRPPLVPRNSRQKSITAGGGVGKKAGGRNQAVNRMTAGMDEWERERGDD